MWSVRIKGAIILALLALSGLTLSLPLASQAATKNTTAPGRPIASTGSVAHVSGTSAVLQGSIVPRNLATTYYFEYGPTAAYGQKTTTGNLAAGSVKVKVTRAVTGFLPGYHYRLVATNANGSASGKDRTFSSTKSAGFDLPKTYTAIPVGSPFVLSGTLTANPNTLRAIVLQATPFPYMAPYANVGPPILTGAGGRFTFRVPNLRTSTKFRVSTVGLTPQHSLVVPQQVAVRVALKVRSSGRKGLVRVYGTVTPAEVGSHVFLQVEQPPKAETIPKNEKPTKLENPAKTKSGKHEKSEQGPTFSTKFSTVAKLATKSISRFSIVINVKTAGHYRALVAVRPGPVVSGHSPSVTLSAAPTAGKKKKKKK
jgi:hypothetical protein